MRNIAKELRDRGGVYPGPILVRGERPDIATLPLRMGLDCQLGKEPAETLQALSRKLRGHLEASIPKGGADPRPNAEELRKRLLGSEGEKPEWLSPDAVPALLQLLQAESAPVRKVLVEVLGKIKDRRATAALAVRSMVDLSPEVREAAILELRRRPREDYRSLLLAGLRYPWLPVIAHAAETLVAVMDKGAVPELVALLEAPHPAAPLTVPIGRKQVMVVRELIRINHLSNCMLCHAPSFDRTDLVRGAVPTPGKPLPAPVTTPQYYDRGGEFVRADITYLRQDFSVIQPVPESGVWPSHQRFDYLVRVRRPTSKELKFLDKHREKLTDEPRELLLFALRELTGKDLGSATVAWKKLLPEGTVTRPRVEGGETAADRDWKQFQSVALSVMPKSAAAVPESESDSHR